MRACVEGVSTTQPSPKVSGTVAECDKALKALVAREPVEMRSMMQELYQIITWEQRAAGTFLYLHPGIYGEISCSPKWQIDMVAAALGVDEVSVRKWFILQNKQSKRYVQRWLPLAKGMTRKDLSMCFRLEWTEQWGAGTLATVTDLVGVYEDHIKGSKETFLSKYTPGTPTAGRKASATKGKSTYMIKKNPKSVVRVDAGKARKYIEQENFIINLVTECWNLGNPLGKIGLKDEVTSRYDCLEDGRLLISPRICSHL